MNSPKPEWLKVNLPSGEGYFSLVKLLKQNNLHTVCQEANCPNIAECFSKKTATFMILGDKCTRNCKYCDVERGVPSEPDLGEPKRVAKAVKKLELHYIVITSVTRDDLEDGGAGIFAETIKEIKKEDSNCIIEVLIPDFKGDEKALRKVIEANPHIINHNIEVVKRVFPEARPQGDYQRSLDLLKRVKSSGVKTKSGLMVGLGESKEEIFETLKDLCSVTDILTIGQYLQPSKEHLTVVKYYTPEEFKDFKEKGEQMGFEHVESGPLVRSSYHAKEYGV